jgi:hypothetical protein
MKKQIILLTLTLLCSEYSRCQTTVAPSRDSIAANVIEQVVLFPQEKLHLHTDKVLYISGETVWFRAYLVDAVVHKPVTNQYILVELVNPLDSVVNRMKIRQTEGAFSGHISLNENLPEGDYTLCAYSENMLNIGEDFFFKKNIRILSPLSATVKTEAEFFIGKGDQLTAAVSFTDLRTRKKISPEGLKLRVNDLPASDEKFSNDTVAYFSFRLPEQSSHRILTVETHKGSKFMTVPWPVNDYEVSFFPEGGYLLGGTPCRIAFKALNSYGLSEYVTGRIVDSVGRDLANLETTHDGMGSFMLTAEAGKTYFAVCTNDSGHEKRFALPEAKNGTYALSIETEEDQLFVSVLRSADINTPEPLYLLLHTRGIIHYASPWDHNYNSLSFNTKKFPSGVMQIILFDGNMNPLSERLVFCLNNDQAQVQFSTDRLTYAPRQQVNARVNITGMMGMPLDGTLSVSVTDDNDIKPDTTTSIMTTLLMTSDLKGYINNPGYYFQRDTGVEIQSLDLLMLTNGWRRYDIPDIVSGKYEVPSIPLKYGMEIRGRVRSPMLGKPVVNGLVAAFSWDAGYYNETATGADGRFLINGIEFPDSTAFVIQALDKKGSGGVELLIDADKFPGVSSLPHSGSPLTETTAGEKKLSNYITKADTRYTIENGMRTVYIEEVVIKGKAPEKNDFRFSFYMPKMNSRIMTSEQIADYQPSSVSDILKYIPHVELVTDEFGMRKVRLGRTSYRLPGGPEYNYAALIIDDIIIHDYDIDNIIDPSDIERIGVLQGAQATLLGSDGAGGAIVITTKQGSGSVNDFPKYNIRKVTPLGYQRPAEFYSPRYDTPEKTDNMQADLRTTIYWNPKVTVSSPGEATFDFYTADSPATYTMIIEGITSDGAIIQYRDKIKRR